MVSLGGAAMLSGDSFIFEVNDMTVKELIDVLKTVEEDWEVNVENKHEPMGFCNSYEILLDYNGGNVVIK